MKPFLSTLTNTNYKLFFCNGDGNRYTDEWHWDGAHVECGSKTGWNRSALCVSSAVAQFHIQYHKQRHVIPEFHKIWNTLLLSQALCVNSHTEDARPRHGFKTGTCGLEDEHWHDPHSFLVIKLKLNFLFTHAHKTCECGSDDIIVILYTYKYKLSTERPLQDP